MISGDIVALYLNSFRLAVAVNNLNVVVIYRLGKVDYESINKILNNIDDLSKILSSEILPESYEIYKTNILITPKRYKKKPKDLFEYLIKNLNKITTFSEGDILKMEGTLMMQYPLYHHNVIFSGIKIL